MLLYARGKINWTLDITGTREDGYHLMDMLMQPVSLYDTIRIEPSDKLLLTTGGYPLLKPNENHLAMKAARQLQLETDCHEGAMIHVDKRIPVGAGMGGGSADAAAVLLGLNRLWKLHLTEDKLEQIGLKIGADVPFCLRGGLCRTKGIGEKLEDLSCEKFFWLVIIQPCKGLSTGDVFKAYHRNEAKIERPSTDIVKEGIQEGNPGKIASGIGNVLRSVSEEMRPEIGKAILDLRNHGAFAAEMTGSGSAVFGVYFSARAAREALKQLSEKYRTIHMVHSCNESVTFEQ